MREVRWLEEQKTLTLTGEPVLECRYAWPETGQKKLDRYYRRLKGQWQRRWERELYWDACLDLAGKRERSRPFTPWTGELRGETVLLQDDVLSLRFHGCEVRGGGRPARVRWGDVWGLREGTPKSLRSLFSGEKGWKKRLGQSVCQRGEERRRAGDCFLDGDWPQKAKRARLFRGWCLTEEGVEVSLPQCAASPAAEGCPVFTLPVRKQEKQDA